MNTSIRSQISARVYITKIYKSILFCNIRKAAGTARRPIAHLHQLRIEIGQRAMRKRQRPIVERGLNGGITQHQAAPKMHKQEPGQPGLRRLQDLPVKSAAQAHDQTAALSIEHRKHLRARPIGKGQRRAVKLHEPRAPRLQTLWHGRSRPTGEPGAKNQWRLGGAVFLHLSQIRIRPDQTIAPMLNVAGRRINPARRPVILLKTRI